MLLAQLPKIVIVRRNRHRQCLGPLRYDAVAVDVLVHGVVLESDGPTHPYVGDATIRDKFADGPLAYPQAFSDICNSKKLPVHPHPRDDRAASA